MSEGIEDELRALLQGRAATVTGLGDPLTGVETGVRRAVARRRLALTAGVPLLAGLVVAGAGLLAGEPDHRPPANTALVSPTASTSAAVSSAVERQSPQVAVFRDYLENSEASEKAAVSATGYGGRAYCALRVLDQSARYAYLWAACQEYYLDAPTLKGGSAGSVPVRLTITGAGASTRVLAIAVPHDGAPERAELKALFSPLAFTRSLAYSDGLSNAPGLDESDAELRARAAADVQSGRLHAGANKRG